MKTYLDIGAVRVQSYIGRVKSLAARRGASALLSEATSLPKIESYCKVLANRCVEAKPNPGAGVADGVVNLELDEKSDCRSAAEIVIGELRKRLPAGEFEAAWGTASSYVEAKVNSIDPMRSRGDGVISLPPQFAWPAAQPCDECGLFPAVKANRSGTGHQDAVCTDCCARLAHGERPTQGRLQELIPDLPEESRASTFDDLANLGSDSKRNHIALVFLDANRMGAFFAALATSSTNSSKDDLSRAMVTATHDALVAATKAVIRAIAGKTNSSPAALPVLAHLVGGDDVLCSVPASFAWLFTRTYIGSFDEDSEKAVGPHAQGLSCLAPTASAGMVISHSSFPFARCLDVAERNLRLAKRSQAGRKAAVAWQDVTRHGDGAAGPDPLAFEDLTALEGSIMAIHGWPRSAQANLSALAGRLHGAHAGTQELLTELERTGRFAALERVTPAECPLPTWTAARWVQVLDAARWWYA